MYWPKMNASATAASYIGFASSSLFFLCIGNINVFFIFIFRKKNARQTPCLLNFPQSYAAKLFRKKREKTGSSKLCGFRNDVLLLCRTNYQGVSHNISTCDSNVTIPYYLIFSVYKIYQRLWLIDLCNVFSKYRLAIGIGFKGRRL